MDDFLGLSGHSPLEAFGDGHSDCEYAQGMARQLVFGAMALDISQKGRGSPAGSKQREEKDKLLRKLLEEGVQATVAHEVGHALGLRHNFKASAYLTLEEINNPEKTRDVGLTASVMDYAPVNIAPKGKKQGDYFSHTIGPYDCWAIEYAYKPAPAKGSEEKMLAKIASRSGEPALQYGTDEDASDSDPDPSVNRFDLGKDPCEFARWRLELVNQLLPGLVDQVTEKGEGYQDVRRAFGVLMSEHSRAMHFVARYIGGVYVNRSHKGDPGAAASAGDNRRQEAAGSL